MKRLVLAAAVLALAACTAKNEEPAAGDTAAPAMAPAPADTAARMGTDTTMKDTAAAKP